MKIAAFSVNFSELKISDKLSRWFKSLSLVLRFWVSSDKKPLNLSSISQEVGLLVFQSNLYKRISSNWMMLVCEYWFAQSSWSTSIPTVKDYTNITSRNLTSLTFVATWILDIPMSWRIDLFAVVVRRKASANWQANSFVHLSVFNCSHTY